jgi:hypothetical protein
VVRESPLNRAEPVDDNLSSLPHVLSVANWGKLIPHFIQAVAQVLVVSHSGRRRGKLGGELPHFAKLFERLVENWEEAMKHHIMDLSYWFASDFLVEEFEDRRQAVVMVSVRVRDAQEVDINRSSLFDALTQERQEG